MTIEDAQRTIAALRGGLILSCQPTPGSPFDTTEAILAYARIGAQAGARGLRIEGVANVRAVAAAVDALAVDVFIALPPQFDETRDRLGRVLQIGVDDHRSLAAAMFEPRRNRDLLAEIAAERDGAKARISGVEGADRVHRAV